MADESAQAQKFELGDVTIQRIVEQEAPFFDAFQFFPSLSRETFEDNRSWLEPKYYQGDRLVLCIQSYVVRTPDRVVLIDTCVGNQKKRPYRPGPLGADETVWDMMSSDRYERNLATVGLTFSDVDIVLCTHLHADHVGWNTRLEGGRWVPAFPKARYLISEREFRFFHERYESEPAAYPWIADSVLPVVEAGNAEFVESDAQIDDWVSLLPTPGHTIDHFAVRVGTPGADAIVVGDLVHTPLQIRYPDIAMFGDYDRAQGIDSRNALFGRIHDTATLLCAPHFPAPSMGLVARRNNGFAFLPGSF